MRNNFICAFAITSTNNTTNRRKWKQFPYMAMILLFCATMSTGRHLRSVHRDISMDPSHLEREWIQAKSKSRRGGAFSELWPFSFIPGSVKLTDPHPHKMTDLWPFGVIFLFLSVSCRSDRSLWWDRGSYSIITSSLLAFCCCFVCEFESLILYCFAFFNSTGNSGSFSMRGWI